MILEKAGVEKCIDSGLSLSQFFHTRVFTTCTLAHIVELKKSNVISVSCMKGI